MNLILFSQIAQLILSILIVCFVLIQYKGKGLSSSIGSSFAFYGSRRGVERLVFMLTIVFGVLLTANSLFLLVLSK